jgi:hypothetical protein
LANTRFWDKKFEGTQNTYLTLLQHIKAKDTVVEIKENRLIEFFKTLDFGKNIKPYYLANDALQPLLDDIKLAKKKITITLPTDKLNPQYEKMIADAVKDRANSGVAVVGKAKELDGLNSVWKGMLFKSKDAAFPLIVIDDKIFWYGFPLTELFFVDKSYRYVALKNPVFRIIGKHTGEMIALKRISNDPYQCTTETQDIHKVANFEKKIPLEWINKDYTDVLPVFHQYARPLIQAELTPIFINGLPRHIYLKQH